MQYPPREHDGVGLVGGGQLSATAPRPKENRRAGATKILESIPVTMIEVDDSKHGSLYVVFEIDSYRRLPMVCKKSCEQIHAVYLIMPPKHIILIRHAEKGDEPVHLSAEGRIRAEGLIDYFARNHHPSGLGTIDMVVAQRQAQEHKSDRSVETILPLAHALRIIPIIRYKRRQLHKILRFLMADACDRRTVLLCMQHEALIKLTNLLGFDVRAWSLEPKKHKSPDAYDVTWVITLNESEMRLRVFRQFDIDDDGNLFYAESPDIPTYQADFT